MDLNSVVELSCFRWFHLFLDSVDRDDCYLVLNNISHFWRAAARQANLAAPRSLWPIRRVECQIIPGMPLKVARGEAESNRKLQLNKESKQRFYIKINRGDLEPLKSYKAIQPTALNRFHR